VEMRLTKLTWVALGFVALCLLGYALSAVYDLPSCTAGPCGGPRPHGWELVFYSGGTGLEPPWFLSVVFLPALGVSLRASRWGLIGLVVMILYSIGFVEAMFVLQLSIWAAGNLGLGLFTWLSGIWAVAVVVLGIKEMVTRSRHGWRLPAKG
jgi:hypothetical protein